MPFLSELLVVCLSCDCINPLVNTLGETLMFVSKVADAPVIATVCRWHHLYWPRYTYWLLQLHNCPSLACINKPQMELISPLCAC